MTGSHAARPSAFSLIEMLTVIAIIGILAILALPAVGTMLEASKLNTAVNQVTDQIALARQTALAQNRRVEVRFYKFATSTENPAYRGIRSYLISETGTASPLSPVREISQPIIISDEASKNSLFRSSPQAYSGTEDLPRVKNAEYFKFSFLPNGRTDFSSGENPFLTIFSSRATAVANGLPVNYAVLQLDAMTGNVRIYRPNK
jgi:uncharacterized protein (TIGR02596 family)